MRIVLAKSQHRDVSILRSVFIFVNFFLFFENNVSAVRSKLQHYFYSCRSFYEERETDFTSKLWRHRNIIGYDHLLQVFSCQFNSSNFPLLEKFLNEQPLLSVTKYIPEFVSLQVKLVQKSIAYFNNTKVKDLYISKFLEFIQKGMLFKLIRYNCIT